MITKLKMFMWKVMTRIKKLKKFMKELMPKNVKNIRSIEVKFTLSRCKHRKRIK